MADSLHGAVPTLPWSDVPSSYRRARNSRAAKAPAPCPERYRPQSSTPAVHLPRGKGDLPGANARIREEVGQRCALVRLCGAYPRQIACRRRCRGVPSSSSSITPRLMRQGVRARCRVRQIARVREASPEHPDRARRSAPAPPFGLRCSSGLPLRCSERGRVERSENAGSGPQQGEPSRPIVATSMRDPRRLQRSRILPATREHAAMASERARCAVTARTEPSFAAFALLRAAANSSPACHPNRLRRCGRQPSEHKSELRHARIARKVHLRPIFVARLVISDAACNPSSVPHPSSHSGQQKACPGLSKRRDTEACQRKMIRPVVVPGARELVRLDGEIEGLRRLLYRRIETGPLSARDLGPK